MPEVFIRPETANDAAVIRDINIAAFANHPFSHQTEHLIVDALREAGALELSLVTEVDGSVVAHIAFSRATIGDDSSDWYLLGPVAVMPDRQQQGVGSALVERGIAELRSRGASGCALVGDPGFYDRFGFAPCAGVTCEGVPDEYVLCLPFVGQVPLGELHHHRAFAIEA